MSPLSHTVILVTGATGMAGLEVCNALARTPGVAVRAALHTPEKGADLPEGVLAVPFDTDDPETVAAALEGVDKLFLLTPGGPAGPPATRAIVDAVRDTQKPLRHIVKLSSYAPEKKPQAPTDLWALEAEEMVRDTGVPWTFLRPPWFDQNFSRGYFVPMVMQRMLTLPFGDGRSGWLDCRDLAAVAAKTLLEDGHAGKTYTPTGPRAIDLDEIARHLSDAAGCEIRYRHLSDEEWVAAAQAAGQPEEVAFATLKLISKTRDGHAEEITTDVETVTGRRPRTFEDFARDHAELFQALARTAPPTVNA